MIGHIQIRCRIDLQQGVTPAERLRLMEIIEKWAVAATGAKPRRFVSSSKAVLFTVQLERGMAAASLRQCLPREWVRDVLIDGSSWNE